MMCLNCKKYMPYQTKYFVSMHTCFEMIKDFYFSDTINGISKKIDVYDKETLINFCNDNICNQSIAFCIRIAIFILKIDNGIKVTLSKVST